MPIAILFHPVSLNAATYERALARLEAVLGGPNPGGRRYHACYGTGDQLSVFAAVSYTPLTLPTSDRV